MTTLSDKIAEVEKMLAEASKPWASDCVYFEDGEYEMAATGPKIKTTTEDGDDWEYETEKQVGRDAALIAAAPTLIASMLEVVKAASIFYKCESGRDEDYIPAWRAFGEALSKFAGNEGGG